MALNGNDEEWLLQQVADLVTAVESIAASVSVISQYVETKDDQERRVLKMQQTVRDLCSDMRRVTSVINLVAAKTPDEGQEW